MKMQNDKATRHDYKCSLEIQKFSCYMLIFSPPPQMFVFVIDISDCCKSHHPGDEPLLLLGDWQLASAAAGGRGHGRHLVHLLNNRFCTSGLVLGNVGAALRSLVIHGGRHAGYDNLLDNNNSRNFGSGLM